MVRPHIHYRVAITTAVVHQKTEVSCVKVALADMMTIIIRMNGDDFDCDYDLTPQIGIDLDGNIRASCRMCTQSNFGFEKTSVNPWFRIPRTFDCVVELLRIKYIIWVQKKDEIEPSILEMFQDGGDGYPIVGIMVMGRFKDPAVAKDHAIEGLPCGR